MFIALLLSYGISHHLSPGRSSKKAANIQKDPGASDGFEAEDRILLDEPYIEDADRYIDEIHFAIPVFTFQQDFFDDKPVRKLRVGKIDNSTMAALEKAVAVAEQEQE